MKDNIEIRLLAELIELRLKYGPNSFRKLARLLESSDFIDNIKSDLLRLDEGFCNSSIEKEVIGQPILDGSGDKDEEPPGPDLALAIRDILQDRTAFPHVKDLIEFASLHGLVVPRATSRARVVSQLMNKFRLLSKEELEQIYSYLEQKRTKDEGLEGWTRIILSERKGPNQSS